MDEKSRTEVYGLGEKLQKELTGKLYDAALLQQVQTYLKDFRAGKKS